MSDTLRHLSAPRSMKMQLAATLIVAVVAVAGAGCSLFVDDRPDTRAIVDAARPVPWRGDVLLHARWRWRDVSVELRAEEWLDTRTGASRSVTYDPSGARTITIYRSGVLRTIFAAGRRGLSHQSSTRLVAGDRRLEDASMLLAFWRKLLHRRASIVDEGELDGRRIWVVEVPRTPASETPEDLRVFGDLDRRTFLPLRVRLESDTPGYTTSFRIRYDRLSPSSAPPGLFRVRKPGTRSKVDLP